jgi:UMF1 family MFS transporter
MPSSPFPPVTRKEIFAWCLFDFANSSFTTLIITVAYSVYFTHVVAQGYPAEEIWGWGYSGSMLVIALLSPVLGALADSSALKKRFLLLFSLLCVIATALLFTVERGDVVSGILLFAVGNIGFAGGLSFYNAFLTEIARPDNMGRISGYGWGLGYVGGLLSLVFAYPLIQGGFGEENLFSYRLSFPMTALFFLLASLPTFLYLRERAVPDPLPPGETYLRVGFRRLAKTLREIRRFRELLKYFVAYLFYEDGINTVVLFSGIFAVQVLKFTPKDLVIFFIVMQVSSALGAYAFGFLTDWIGAKRTISLTLILWMGIVTAAYGVQTQGQFYVVGLLAGVALGSNQSASRVLLGLFTPVGRSAEFFGFFSLTGKMAAIAGPMVYGTISSHFGGQRPALVSIGIFFLIGLVLLQRVDERKGREAAC